jgi:hypothetical protein
MMSRLSGAVVSLSRHSGKNRFLSRTHGQEKIGLLGFESLALQTTGGNQIAHLKTDQTEFLYQAE